MHILHRWDNTCISKSLVKSESSVGLWSVAIADKFGLRSEIDPVYFLNKVMPPGALNRRCAF